MADRIPGLDRLKGTGRTLKDITNLIDNLPRVAEKSAKDAGAKFAALIRNLDAATDSAKRLEDQMRDVGDGSFSMLRAVDKVGKAITSLGTSIIGLGINLLIDGIQRVYELKERWARVTGAMRMQIGGLSHNVKGAVKLMSSWEGVMHGLTGQFGTGSQMANEFAATLETMNKRVVEGSRFMGIVLARGFNLGATASGELLKSMRSIGITADNFMGDMARMTQLASAFQVPVNAVAKDLEESRNMIVGFGRDGVKSMTAAAVHLRRFNIGLKDTDRLMGTFDQFDSATEATAKLNTVFGTTISSMDMLLTQNPADRIERVRQQLLAQGRSFDTMSRYEVKVLETTLGLESNQIAMLMKRENAGLSFQKVQEKQAKLEEKELKAKEKMKKMLAATRQTMFSFSQAFDAITVGIAKALRPLLEALGLIKSSNEEWGDFADVMRRATNWFERFFEGLAKSPKWIKMMQSLADRLKDVGRWLANISTDDFTSFFDTAVSTFNKIKWIVAGIAGLWTGMRIVEAGVALTGAARGIARARGMGGVAGVGLGIAGGAAGGAGIGHLLGGNTAGGAVGGAIGGGIGAFGGALFGPRGQAIGGAIGTAIGGTVGAGVQFIAGKIGDMVDSGAATGLSYYEDILNKEKQKALRLEQDLNKSRKLNSINQRLMNAQRSDELLLTKRLLAGGEKKVRLLGGEKEEMLRLVKNMKGANISTKFMDKAMKRMSDNGGSLVMTNSELKQAHAAIQKLHAAQSSLTQETMKLAGFQAAMRKAELAKQGVENKMTRMEAEKERALAELSSMKGGKKYADIASKEGVAAALAALESNEKFKRLQTARGNVQYLEKTGKDASNWRENVKNLEKSNSGLVKMEQTLLGISRHDQKMAALKTELLKKTELELKQKGLMIALEQLSMSNMEEANKVRAALRGESVLFGRNESGREAASIYTQFMGMKTQNVSSPTPTKISGGRSSAKRSTRGGGDGGQREIVIRYANGADRYIQANVVKGSARDG